MTMIKVESGAKACEERKGRAKMAEITFRKKRTFQLSGRAVAPSGEY